MAALAATAAHSFVLHPGVVSLRPASPTAWLQRPRSRPRVGLNRILLELEEVSAEPPSPLLPQRLPESAVAFLPMADPRAQHVALVLRARDGDTVRAGVLDVGACDAAEVAWRWPEGYAAGWDADRDAAGAAGAVPSTERARARPGKVKQKVWPVGLALALKGPWQAEPVPRPRVDLLLALPRPLQLARMLPAIAQLGVGTLVLTNAAKVEVPRATCCRRARAFQMQH